MNADKKICIRVYLRSSAVPNWRVTMPGIFEVSIETHFCAAHALREYKGATEPVHGHNFKVIVNVSGKKVDRAGMAIDFLELKPVIDEEVGRLHYGFLNENV